MRHRYLEDVASLSFDEEKCTGCGMCAEVCPHGVFVSSEGVTFVADKDACMECGACDLNCPYDAIRVDAGTGCATAFIMSWFSGSDATCGCNESGSGACCG